MTTMKVFRCIAWLLVGAVTVVTLSPLEMRPTTPAPADLERFLAFALIGGAFSLGYPKQRLGILVAVIGLVGVLELAQQLTPWRHGRLHDGLIKASGALFGAAAVMIQAGLRRAP